MRLLLIGDCHLRAGDQLDDVQAALEWAAALADERDVHAVLMAGDLFEGRSTVVERQVLAQSLDDLRYDKECVERPVVVCRGNHDQLGELPIWAGYDGVTVCEDPRIVTIRNPSCVINVDVLVCPWPERAYLVAKGYAGEAGDQAGSAALGAMLRGMVATRDSHNPLIVLAHLQVNGAISSSAQPLVGRAIEATLGDLQDLGASFVCLGHVHRPQELAPGIEYAGSLTCHDFGEESEEKRVGILTVEDDGKASVEWVPVPCRRWVTVEADVISGVKDESVEGAPVEDDEIAGANVRYRYSCDESEQSLFDHAEITSRFATAHTLKIVPEVTRTQRVRAADVAAAKTPADKLAAWGQATGQEITPALVEKLHMLESEVSNG